MSHTSKIRYGQATFISASKERVIQSSTTVVREWSHRSPEAKGQKTLTREHERKPFARNRREKVVPWRSFGMNVYSQICPCLHLLVLAENSVCLLGLSHCLSFQRRTLAVILKERKLFVQFKLFWCGCWRRGGTQKSIMDCSKIYQIFHIPRVGTHTGLKTQQDNKKPWSPLRRESSWSSTTKQTQIFSKNKI